jgi:serine/threonine protein kinase
MPALLEQFILDLSASRLLPAEEVASLQKALQGSKTSHTVEEIAKLLVQNGKLTEYQAATISQGRPQSLILGEYVLLNILGKGGMGVVFLARHRLMDRVVALKTLPTAAIQPDSVQRFYREVKAAARLSHPNIVTAYDAGEHGGTHYLVMEYVAGRDLSAIVKEKGPLPLRRAIDYVQQAARGLDFAHKHGVVHRDVKPRNLLLDQEGVVKILDMGLARFNEGFVGSDEAFELTGTGQILGTVDYMSPEQAEDVRLADERSDIYSLGCTLFYLLNRRPVYGGETILQRILRHRDEPVPSLLEFRPDCPARLSEVFQWMLAKQPQDRPQTMAEVLVALDDCLEKPNAAPPLSGPKSDKAAQVQNWLEDLAGEEPAASTENSRVHEATQVFPLADDLPSSPLKTGGSNSSVRRSKQKQPRRGMKWAAIGGGRTAWKIAAGVVAAGVVVAALAMEWSHLRSRSDEAAREDSAAKPDTASAAPSEAKSSGSAAPAPTPPPSSPAWDEAWIAAKGRADGQLAQQHFANAIGEYKALADRFPDPVLKQRSNDAIHRIETEADEAYQKVEAIAREHLRQRRFVPARTAVQLALASYGAVPAAVRARKLLDEINQAARSALPPVKTAEAPKPPENEAPQPPAVPPELLKQRQLDATFAQAMAPIENRVTAWDFQGALKEAEAVHFHEPELTARLNSRREQVRRMADLKDRMIAAIDQAEPRLTKADLMLQGINGDLTKADAAGIAATLRNGKDATIAWPDVGPKALQRLLQLIVRHNDAGDCLAAGLMTLASGNTQSAEQFFEKARSLGVDTASYRALLAAREFAAIRDLLAQHKYAESEASLAALQENFGSLSWFAANKAEVDAALKEAKQGLREKEAEGLFAQATALLHNGDLYELRPVVVRLKTQYAESAVVADPQRKTSLAEMEKAVAELGPLLRVRKDGKGDATTIQDAVRRATAKTMIEIEEAGPWAEQVVISADKDGITIRGKKGLLPIITAAGARTGYAETFLIESPHCSLERLAIVRADAAGLPGLAITADTTALSLRGVAVYGHTQAGRSVSAKDCVFVGHVAVKAIATLQNLVVTGGIACGPNSQLRHCTITGPLHLAGVSSSIVDCIVASINAPQTGHTIEHCDVFGVIPPMSQAKLGKGCLKALPLFADPKSLDFRLQPGSPCRRTASDGSDMGFIWTAEMQALLRTAGDQHNRRSNG